MTFLEAKKILASLHTADKLPFLLAMSGTPDQLELYLRAHAARAGLNAEVQVLPFGTLSQHLHSPAQGSEVFLLLPWDLAPECDWRSGLGTNLADADTILEQARQVTTLLGVRKAARIAYIPAPIPPVCASRADNARLSIELTALAVGAGASLLPGSHFTMASYLASGGPLAGTALSAAAETLIGLLLTPPPGTYKVIATDADNTLWAGIVGEDGVDAVSAEPHGVAFRHFIYQSFLARLKAAGILLAVVSRNDEDMVSAPFGLGRMPLSADDFVAIQAGYGAKSDHIRSLATNLNLGLDSVIFVDDNPVELAEVAAALPSVTCLTFPTKDDALAGFLDRLAALFDRTVLTAEDAERTELYRRRLTSQYREPSTSLVDYLKNLQMVLTLRDRTHGDWKRAHQLINKTNQFNLNGRRLDEIEVTSVLADGGHMMTATLADRTGSHGEILACLLDADGRVLSLVMSCRVFQRHVEFAFMAWLLAKMPVTALDVTATKRNEPARNFLADGAFAQTPEGWKVDAARFLAEHAEDLTLFTIREDAE